MQAKPFRENVDDFIEPGWSDWEKAMVPNQPGDDPENLQARTGSGSIWRNIRNALPARETRNCGIYEWQVRRGRTRPRVVYVGCTCSDPSKEGTLSTRILEYCRNGSHKKDLINDALNRGYELWVRFRFTGSTKRSTEARENALLDTYNYAWNERRNGVRHILT